MLITYSVFLCFMHAAVCASAADPVKKSSYGYSISPAKTTTVVEKSFPFPFGAKADHTANNLFSRIGYRLANAIFFSPGEEERFFQLIDRLTKKEIVQKPEVERVLKDYLLHIFPSHYFW